MKNKFQVFLCVILSLVVCSCSEDGDKETGSMAIEFDNVVGEEDLTLLTVDEPYTNAASESYAVTLLRYYISQIRLHHSDGSVFEDAVNPDGSAGYYLIDESDPESLHVSIENVPVGDYTGISFTVGIDYDALQDGTLTGALSQDKGMFIDNNAGFFFLKMEGHSASTDQALRYHVSGYAAPTDNMLTKTVVMEATPAMVRTDKTPKVHLIIDINEFFTSPNDISFAASPSLVTAEETAKIAENYGNTFVFDHVHN
ncbi:MAG TPA: MbnP family protein [Ohtaekwangia sp.]|nr:MbnP family protein [Ohtaekwangia sp.]